VPIWSKVATPDSIQYDPAAVDSQPDKVVMFGFFKTLCVNDSHTMILRNIVLFLLIKN